MHKRLGLTLFAGLAILVTACGPGTASVAPTAAPPSVAPPSDTPSDAPSTEPSAALTPIKVGVVTDVGQLEAKSFNQSSNDGAKAAAAAVGGTHDVIVTQNISDYGQTSSSSSTRSLMSS
jgi:basic membrane lipoprotein Med (substrate-binding protein (PBP1-ABC) superfamily)